MLPLARKLTKLYASGQRVFSLNELMLYWNYENKDSLYVELSRLVKKNYLKKIKRGLYLLPEFEADLDPFEVAGKLYPWSYISFESVLAKEGIINQWYGSVFLAGPRTLTIKNKYGTFRYRKMPFDILTERLGIQNEDGKYFIATKERAVCDYFYKVGFQQLDDPYELDPRKLRRIARIYGSKRLKQDIADLIKIIKAKKHAA